MNARGATNLAESEQIVLSCSIDRPGQDLSYVIPAVSYDGNGWGRGQEPKGLYDSADAEQALWVFGGDRCSVPACTISEDARCAVALHGVPADAAQSGCALGTPERGIAALAVLAAAGMAAHLRTPGCLCAGDSQYSRTPSQGSHVRAGSLS